MLILLSFFKVVLGALYFVVELLRIKMEILLFHFKLSLLFSAILQEAHSAYFSFLYIWTHIWPCLSMNQPCLCSCLSSTGICSQTNKIYQLCYDSDIFTLRMDPFVLICFKTHSFPYHFASYLSSSFKLIDKLAGKSTFKVSEYSRVVDLSLVHCF
jgi:hypothetical protein